MSNKLDIVRHTIDAGGVSVKIRTKLMKEGILQAWSYNDVAHIWINKQMYRITDKGTLIAVEMNP